MTTEAKIFGIGLSRTGTTSLVGALGKLGFRASHSVFELYSSPLHPLLDQYQAFADAPLPLRYPLYDRCYPGSRWILTVRDQDKWLSSMRWMFKHGKVFWNWSTEVFIYHRQLYGTDHFEPSKLLQAYEKHVQDVTSYFSGRPSQLLILDVSQQDADARLAEFLGCDTSSTARHDMPRMNARSMNAPMRRRVAYFLKERLAIRPGLSFSKVPRRHF